MQVSVIIAVYNRASLLTELLEQWRKVNKVTNYEYELIFSDDESSDNSVEVLKACHDLPMRVLENKHGGASKARNHAYQYAKGELIIFTGDDIFPSLNFVNEHYEAYLKNGSNFASLGCIDWRPGIKMNHLMKHITDIGCEQFGFVGMRPFEVVDFRHFYTSNISVAREKLEQVKGLFSLEFKKYGFEDVDLGYRLHKKGVQIIYNPNALGYHDHIYDSVEKFCKRQESAGGELNTFKRLHPNLNKEEIKLDIDEFHYKYSEYIDENLKVDMIGDGGRILIYLMIQMTKIMERLMRYKQYDLIEKICSKLYSIIFRYYMYLGLAYDYAGLPNLPKYKAKRYTFRYLFFGRAQIFYDKSNQFTETKSEVFHTAGSKIVKLSIDIPAVDLGRIRFDALDDFCKIRLLSAVAYVNQVKKEDILFEYTNAKKVKNQKYNFSNQIDPILISKELPKNTEYIEIKYQVNYLLFKRIIYQFRNVAKLGKRILKKILNGPKPAKRANQPLIDGNIVAKRKVWITVKTPSHINQKGLIEQYSSICSHLEDVKITADTRPNTEKSYTEYIYEISNMHHSLEPVQFLNASLCLLQYNYDFIILSDGLSSYPNIYNFSLQDCTLIAASYGSYNQLVNGEANTAARGKILRIPGSKKIEQQIDLTDAIPNINKLEDGTLRIWKPETKLLFNDQSSFSLKAKNKPVVFVLPVFMAVGGVERNTIELMSRLKSDYDFVVITFESHRFEQGSLFYQIVQLGIDYYDFAEISSFENYNYLLEKLNFSYSTDLVWICNNSPWMMNNSSEIRRIFHSIPIVVQDVYDYQYGWIEYYNRPAIHSYDRYIAVNKKIQEKFVNAYGISAADIDLIYSATDTEKIKKMTEEGYMRDSVLQELNLDAKKKYFAFIGRFTEQKQPLKLTELAKYIVEKYEHIDFIMVGDGELSEKVDERINQYQLNDRIHRIKYISNVSQFVKALEGLFITSLYEGLPIVTIEAMCVGTPIFSTDVGDIGLFVTENNIGKVSQSNEIGQLKKEFDNFYSDLTLYKENASKNAFQNIDFFSSRRAAELMKDSFQKALEKYE
ncbi:glycosyltransferase [Saccharibacillus brassicae]|uniref:Glycosyltransferase n=1 Tax=Saccharibacillus brassicae TaxID=2583377 RepID=A0A4Y6UWN8_SACBS|nr:glycosyltransferase [Saccharibacillus brassicae]QDH20791.1 glycosyltransferase [Saccharibacillus brassicae]